MPNANEVIRIGRNRIREASIAASRIGLPCTMRFSRATSTIKMPFFAESAIIRMSPIWVYRLLATPRLVSATTGPKSANGTADNTANGRIQLSYWPARQR
jgi:hypothetical protein